MPDRLYPLLLPTPIFTNAISDYIAHVRHYFLVEDIVPPSVLSIPLRSPLSAGILIGYSKIDLTFTPFRLNAFVPLTYALSVQLLDIIRHMYHSPADEPIKLAISAAYSLGFAISARPQEYLALRRSVDMKYKINSD